MCTVAVIAFSLSKNSFTNLRTYTAYGTSEVRKYGRMTFITSSWYMKIHYFTLPWTVFKKMSVI